MDPRKSRIQEFVENLPFVTTVEINQLDMSCQVNGKRFAWWFEPEGSEVVLAVCVSGSTQVDMIVSDPARFVVPPVKSYKNWLGIRLDVEPIDWAAVEALLREAYKLKAPRQLVKRFLRGEEGPRS